MKLYEIPAEWERLLGLIEEGAGEVTPEIEAEAASLIDASKAKLEAAGLAMRNLDIHAASAAAQAKVFEEEAARCNAMAKAFEAASDRLSMLMAPALAITGKVKTAAGTLFTRTTTSWSFDLKPGAAFYELPSELWRQRDPELNKSVLKKLAEAGTLPEQVAAAKAETTKSYLKTPAAKTTETENAA